MENEKLKMENYKQTELGLIPEDWEVKEVKKIAKIYDGTHSTPNYVDYGIPFYSVEHITSNNFKNTKFISEEVFFNENKRVKLERGDILMSRIGDIGTAKYIDWDVNASFYVTLALFKKITEKIDFKFITFSINSSVFAKELHKRTLHVAFPKKINLGDIGKCKIPLPPLPEQKKIADCLSTWDCAIEKQSQLINALTQRKKALMQQLLTGKKRLPGFKGEWKEVKLGEIGEIQTGNTPSKLESENWNGEYYWCTAEDMKSKYVNNTAQKLTKKGWSLARTVKANSILVTCIASIGINAITNVECSFNQQINSITPNENFSTEFIYYLMNNSKENLLKYAGAGALPMLNKNTFSSIKFKFPTLSEQTAIAEILATADRELQLQKEKLAQLQQQKKGLMQVLLTGKKRLIN